MKSRHKKWIGLAPLFIAGAVFLFGWIVMLLWNAALVPVTNVAVITFWQAIGILVLSRILFGGFGGRGWGRQSGRPLWKEKWMNMSDEEKMKFREEWKQRFGGSRESGDRSSET